MADTRMVEWEVKGSRDIKRKKDVDQDQLLLTFPVFVTASEIFALIPPSPLLVLWIDRRRYVSQ